MGFPNIAHRIWFGEPLPGKYYDYLRNLRELNPNYIIKLWIDPSILSSESQEEIKLFCEKYTIEVCNIREVPELLNHDLIIEELEASRLDVTHRKLHYVRASDIARVGILEKEGGLYTDTDTIMKMPLFDLTANHGFLLKALLHSGTSQQFNYFKVPAWQANYQYFFCNILYDFLAFTPHHILLKTAAKITRLDYEIYQRSKHKNWERSNNAAVLGYGTVRLTGTSIKHALNFLYQTGSLVLNNPSEIFLAAPFLMDSTYDKSWLEGFGEFDPSNVNADENNELDAFLAEIDSQRLLSYPIKDHGVHPELAGDPEEIPIKTGLHSSNLDIERLLKDFKSRSNSVDQLLINRYSIVPQLLPNSLHMPDITLPQFDYYSRIKIPEVNLNFHVDVSAIKFKIFTREMIYDAYTRNNGGLLAKFSIFVLNPNSTPSDLIKILQERSAASSDPNSASRRTLQELGEDAPPLRNGFK